MARVITLERLVAILEDKAIKADFHFVNPIAVPIPKDENMLTGTFCVDAFDTVDFSLMATSDKFCKNYSISLLADDVVVASTTRKNTGDVHQATLQYRA